MFKCLVFIGAIAGGFATGVIANTATLANVKDLKSLQTKMLAVDGDILSLQRRQQASEQKLADIEDKIGVHAALLRTLQAEVDEKDRVLAITEKRIKDQKAQVVKHRKTIELQVIAAYQAGKNDRLKLAMSQKDTVVSSRVMVYYNYLNKMRLHDVSQIEKDVHQMGALEFKQNRELAALNQVLQKKQAEQTVLTDMQQSRAAVLKRIRAELMFDVNQLNQLKLAEQELAAITGGVTQRSRHADVQSVVSHTQIDKVVNERFDEERGESSGKSFNDLKGRLMWPVSGRHAGKVRGGVLILAAEGQGVHSVASGRVLFSGRFPGHGKLIIVEHKGGYMSVYGFNQSLYKQKGDSVKSREVIAAVGQSGGQMKAGLYFEIRREGRTLNPDIWCKK